MEKKRSLDKKSSKSIKVNLEIFKKESDLI